MGQLLKGRRDRQISGLVGLLAVDGWSVGTARLIVGWFMVVVLVLFLFRRVDFFCIMGEQVFPFVRVDTNASVRGGKRAAVEAVGV